LLDSLTGKRGVRENDDIGVENVIGVS